MSQPLEGIKVLDLATMVLGPLAAQYLGDMGADVVKVEPPEGDLMRNIGPRHSDGMGAFFLGNNRNKRSIVLDLKTRGGLETLYMMVRQSDVVIHSVRAKAAERLGISHAALSAQNPRIVYCHVKGYSDEGLYAGKPAYDDIGQAESGLAVLQSVVGGQPRYVPSILADKVAALHAAYGILAALLQRDRTGVGQAVHVPMFETMVAFNSVEHLWGESFVPPLASTGYVPISTGARRPFRTRDGRYICVLPYNQGHWDRFCEVVGDPELHADSRYSSFAARQSDQVGFWAEVGRRILQRDHADWMDSLSSADVPVSRVNSMDDLLIDPHLESVDFWQTVEHETEGTLRMPGSPFAMTGRESVPMRPPPVLGEHRVEILHDIGLSDENIATLASGGAFGAAAVGSDVK
jgi:crotonobetainyl-CoA:carnitine CoA-transferase CaiB-like acyl-CoA transferase